MPHRFFALSGFVLAGGGSRRMGRPKDQLELGGEAMVERQVRLLRAVARSVAVLGHGVSLAGLDIGVIPDEQQGLGPLGGIATALGHTRTEYNLFVGCDMPFVQARFLRYLCAEALKSQADATVPQSPRKGLQPTCAVYRRRALRAVRACLERGNLSVRSFFPRVRLRVLQWPEIASSGFGAVNFENMNTPEDYRSAQLRLGSPE
jgi:molybdenum cofactor guanylyltransferase